MNPDWRDHAACATTGPDLWFAIDANSIAAAIAICNDCPVRTDCLRHALTTGEHDGIWGGLTPPQRDRVARKRKPGPPIMSHQKIHVCPECGNTYPNTGSGKPPARCPDCRAHHNGPCSTAGCSNASLSRDHARCPACLIATGIHGTGTMWSAGCRCDSCKDGQRRRRNGQRRREAS